MARDTSGAAQGLGMMEEMVDKMGFLAVVL